VAPALTPLVVNRSSRRQPLTAPPACRRRAYLANGGDPNVTDLKGQSPLQFAAGYGRGAAVQQLLEGGADVDLQKDGEARTALHRAAAFNHVDILQQLLRVSAEC
jgi:uncharacterized protein